MGMENGELLETGGGDGCTAMCIYVVPLICTLKNGESGQFYVTCILPQ